MNKGIILKLGYHMYTFCPDYMHARGSLISVLGCRLIDDAGHFVGYMQWDSIPPVNQEAIEQWTEAHLKRMWNEYQLQKAVADGVIVQNRKLR